MIKFKFLFFLIVLLLPYAARSQQVIPAEDFSKADSLAMTVKYDGDINLLTKQLTNPFSAQLLKARVIFRWITENIGYDFKYFDKYYYKGKEPKGFECSGDSLECKIKQDVWEADYINKVLDKKMAVCQGYSMLFKKMCNIAGIECEVIPGYIRTEDYEIGTAGNLDHAWNAVKIDGTYYLVDATWAAGGCGKDDNGKLLSFQKHYDNYYWLTQADEFARNHYPEEPKWVLLANYTKDKFALNPYYSPDEISNLKVITPNSGTFTVKAGETVHFKLKYTGDFHFIQINSNTFRNPDIWYWDYISKRKRARRQDTAAIKKQQYIAYTRNNDIYEFDYKVKDRTLEYLDVLFDSRRVMRFKVNVAR